ncbi:MAG: TSUP family transporter [Myxococcota bacterium]
MEISLLLVLPLVLVATLAGFVDAIAGGGGLLTLPALLLSGLPPQLALGTNKGQSVFGSGMALYRFSRSTLLDIPRARVSALPAFLGAAAGVLLVTRLSPDVLRPLVMVLLAAVAVFLLLRPPVPTTTVMERVTRPAALAVAVAAGIGAYDGFFGPGTGTFLIMAYVGLWRDRMDAASANAKVVNFMSNLASVLAFALQGAVLWKIALPMAAGQALGGHFGALLTLKKGQPLVRTAVIVVCLALVARLGWQLI